MGELAWIVPLISTAASLYSSQSMARKTEHAQKNAMKQYDQLSLPNESAVNAQATQNRGELAQARLGAYQNMGSIATWGFGPGSGLMEGGAREIESGYLKSLGDMATDLTKFSNTRQFAPPGQAYASATPGMSQGLGQMGDQYLGYSILNKIINPKSPLPSTSGLTASGAAAAGPTSATSNLWSMFK